MKTKNVFVVTGRYRDVAGIPRGAIVDLVVCAQNDEAARAYVGGELPTFAVGTVTGLAALEARVKKIKAVLAQQDTSWPVYVEPALLALEAG
jgi:hypothetical protein